MRWVDDYVRATENEIAIDAYFYGLLGFQADEFGNVPRPAKWLQSYAHKKGVIRFCAAILRFFWQYGGAATFFLMELVRFYRYWNSCENRLADARAEHEYALAFSSRAVDIIHPPVIDHEPACWITFPWASINVLPKGSRQYDIFSLLDTDDLLKACRLSIQTIGEMSRCKETAGWELQGYTAFRWLVTRIALEKLGGGRFLIAEHYDRWAILADMVAASSESMTNGQGHEAPVLTLVQHGTLAGLAASDDRVHNRLHFGLKCPLNAVARLYVYDEQSAEVFKNDILTPACVARGVDIHYFKPQITLTPVPAMGRVRVLYVGHPICEDLHIHLHEFLKNEYGMDVYYKPHPTAAMSERARSQDWHIVEGRNNFPEVDMLISYPSTLVNEYSNLGIPAVIHSLNLDKNAASEFVATARAGIGGLVSGNTLFSNID